MRMTDTIGNRKKSLSFLFPDTPYFFPFLGNGPSVISTLRMPTNSMESTTTKTFLDDRFNRRFQHLQTLQVAAQKSKKNQKKKKNLRDSRKEFIAFPIASKTARRRLTE
jgi:hypothetical protein